MAYAEATKVTVEKSVAEIVTLVRKNAGSQIAQLDDDNRYVIAFTMADRQVRFTVVFDPVDHKRFQLDGRGSMRTAAQRRDHWEQHRRQRMRAMLLVIKAKFESVESGVETFEQAFLANVVTSNGLTVHERISEDLAIEYQKGSVRPLMLDAPR